MACLIRPKKRLPQYSVIIPLYNKKESIVQALKSVLEQTHRPSQILVIDDKSIDDSLEVLKDSDVFPEIELSENLENLGKAKTINQTIQNKVKYPFVLIMDADTFLDKNFVKEAMKGFRSRRVKGVGGQVFPSDVKTFIEKIRAIEYIVSPSIKWIQNRLHGVWVLSGCASIWRTFFLKKHPIPDTIVEDMDLTWITQSSKDYKKRPFEAQFLSKARCYTQEPQTFKQMMSQLHRWYSNREVFKHFRKARIGLKLVCAVALGSFSFGTIWLISEILKQNFFALGMSMLTWNVFWTALALYGNRKFKISKKDLAIGLLGFFGYLFLISIVFSKSLIKPKKKW